MPAPDSDATTVPAKTPDAKRMAADSFAAAQDQAQPAAMTHSNRPKLKREIQSQNMLTEPAPEDQDSKSKRLRRMDGHQLKQSPSTEHMSAPKQAPAATAVKAKAAPPPTAPKEETSPQAKAVAECLGRSSTQDMESTQGEPKETGKDTEPKETGKDMKVCGKVAGDPGNPPDPDDSSSEDSDEFRKKEALLKAKREAHARYMRFSRSLTSTFANNFMGGILVNVESCNRLQNFILFIWIINKSSGFDKQIVSLYHDQIASPPEARKPQLKFVQLEQLRTGTVRSCNCSWSSGRNVTVCGSKVTSL